MTKQHEIVDDVWLMNEHGPQALEIDEAINYHKEFAQPCMLNNMNGFFHIRMILDMKSKKKGIYSIQVLSLIEFNNHPMSRLLQDLSRFS